MSNRNWNNDTLQFARLIAELEAIGALTPKVIRSLEETMDLTRDEVMELVDRARARFDKACARLCPRAGKDDHHARGIWPVGGAVCAPM